MCSGRDALMAHMNTISKPTLGICRTLLLASLSHQEYDLPTKVGVDDFVILLQAPMTAMILNPEDISRAAQVFHMMNENGLSMQTTTKAACEVLST